jgi:hypothetical protein
MKERPILFSGSMVTAILDGRKTQTRRVIKHQPYDNGLWPRGTPPGASELDCPYGKPGDRLWVRETWADMTACYSDPVEGESPLNVAFKADDSVWNVYGKAVYLEQLGQAGLYVDKWKPSIHMHRQSSRITLEITGVRVERLNDISEGDAIAEGITWLNGATAGHLTRAEVQTLEGKFIHQKGFANIWNFVNGKKHPWSSNPWVWVVEFKRIEE